MHKSGFVNIIGNPNVGKSTLMNELVGERLSIITSKAQTTRHRIMGILSGEDFQIVFSDTPGFVKPSYKMQEGMMGFVHAALLDADVFLLVTDINEPVQKIMDLLPAKVLKSETPVLIIINKIDTSNQQLLEDRTTFWAKEVPHAEVIPVSALKKFNTDYVLNRIKALLPESPAYFEKDQLTDKSERFFASEIIREKILLQYEKEIPYSVEVIINTFKDEEKIIRIQADIYVNRDTQKAIIIGHKGSRLKTVGTQARLDMETFFQKKVFLELFVKVRKGWRENESDLKRFGYFDH